MNRWFKLTAAVVAIAMAASIGFAAEPPNIEGQKLRINGTGHVYKPITDAAATASTSTWAVDSNAVDTSNSYSIMPGCFVAIGVKTDAAADTLNRFDVDISFNGTDWVIYDSLGAADAGISTYAYKALNSGLAVVGRYLRIRIDNDDGAGAATTVTAHIVASPTMND